VIRSASAIPDWNTSGFIPPIRPGEPGHSPQRSPYKATLLEVIDRFGTSPDRLLILKGFLDHRAALCQVGLEKGFQWLNGSFVEDKEAREGASPADVDVVTFASLPPGKTQEDLNALNPQIFNQAHVKEFYKVDGYFQFLGKPSDGRFVRQTSYWNSMWSHTRRQEWKGFVEVDLDHKADADARTYLASLKLIY
jgi:hypothetical protein